MRAIHPDLFELSVAPFPPPRSDGPARLPVVPAGEPRHVL
jgi:hypothetical protein